MRKIRLNDHIEVFSTCPQIRGVGEKAYLRTVIEASRWSEEIGCKGILVYTDNSQVDSWLVSQTIVLHTTSLCPLVAVQPIYMHPYAVAKMVSSVGCLHGRRVYLNMVAGGFKNDLSALNDTTPHDQRYRRLIEYTDIIKRLLACEAPVSYEGRFYRVDKLQLSPALPRALFPGIFVSGSSEEGLAAAKALGATAIEYPKPAKDCRSDLSNGAGKSGIRVGILAREREEEAWEVACARFPEDRKGQLAHQFAMKVSDSVWHRQLSEMGQETADSPYWLVPFRNFHTMCPYLVGSYERVAGELARYLAVGYRTFILDIPASLEDLRHTAEAFRQALER